MEIHPGGGGSNTKPDPSWLAQQFAAITTAGTYTITVTEDLTEPGAIWFDVPGAIVTLKGATGNEEITVSPTIGETFLGIRGGTVILENIKVTYNASTSGSLFYTDVSGALKITAGAEIISGDDIFIRGTFEMTGGSFTYTNIGSSNSGLSGRGGTMTISGGTVNSTIWAGTNATVTIGGGSNLATITGPIRIGEANSSFEKKANSTVSQFVTVYGANDASVVAFAPGINEPFTAKVNPTDDGIIDKTGAWKGTFQVKITGILATIMQDGRNGYIRIGMGDAYILTNDGLNDFAGRDTIAETDADIIGGGPGDNWEYTFFMYSPPDSTEGRYIDSAGNYDISIIVKPGGANAGTKKVLRSQAFKVGELNTFVYSAFGNF